MLRTVDAREVHGRAAAGEHDAALQALIRRTPPAGRGGARGATSAGPGRSGHTRAPAHRATGR
ncbi:hypothetical protein FSW04_15530 [Baekduia soli]|uniref:Uncharacterized protein n=1 Tax=Baekduia soli TaxID=496014 RepID=A0A5B8U7F1_9ACTN|nr:hypothetical protein [Baekduia soli]QEC48845.1 hypothetical protein FSW04_15530 [Baekduia soli]